MHCQELKAGCMRACQVAVEEKAAKKGGGKKAPKHAPAPAEEDDGDGDAAADDGAASEEGNGDAGEESGRSGDDDDRWGFECFTCGKDGDLLCCEVMPTPFLLGCDIFAAALLLCVGLGPCAHDAAS